MVLDGDDQFATGFEKVSDALKHRQCRMLTRSKQIGIFENADEGDHIEFLVTIKSVKLVTDDGDIIQITCSGPGDRRSSWATFKRQHIAATLTQEAGNRATAGANFKNIPTQICLKGPQDVGASAAQVIDGWPVRAVRT